MGAVNVPEVWVVDASQTIQPPPLLYVISYRWMSVTPESGAHVTRKLPVVRYVGSGFTWEPGRTVSTIVLVSFTPPPPPGPDSTFPARSVATVANSYVPSPGAVNAKNPKFPAGWVAKRVHPLPFRL